MIDEVIGLLNGAPPTYRELYYRWEAEQWQAALVDLEEDRGEWSRRPGPDTLVERLSGVRVAIEALRQSATVLADSVPTAEQQVFLTTQMADEARRAVLLDRFFSEVVGMDGVAERQPRPPLASLLRALTDSCTDVEALRRDRQALTACVLICHLIVENGFLLSGVRFIVDALAAEDSLRGLRAGLTLAAQDSTRHVAFGQRFLREACSRSERNRTVVQSRLEEAVPALRSALMLHGPRQTEPPGGPEPEVITSYALESLTARLEAAGLGSRHRRPLVPMPEMQDRH